MSCKIDTLFWHSSMVIVATMDKGGTGLSYHDVTGQMPQRVQLNMNLPWSGTQVEQVSGRLARLGTAKPVHVEWLFADNIPFERELSKTVGSRMVSMKAAVQGVHSESAARIKDFEFESAPASPGQVALKMISGDATDISVPGQDAVIPAKYAVVELKSIIPSHDYSTQIPVSNVDRGIYPESLQPRD